MTEDQNTIANNIQTENIVKKILTSEVKYIIGIILFLAGVVAPYYDIRQEIALIKQNHLAHIEQMEREIQKNSNDILRMTSEQTELMKSVIENNTKINNLEKYK